MDLAVAQKACVLEARNQAKHARLLAELQMILKADKIVGIGAQVFLAQLHDSIWRLYSSRIFQAHWLHRAETKCVTSPPRDLFDGKAAFEVVQLFPVTRFHGLGFNQRVIETVIVFL